MTDLESGAIVQAEVLEGDHADTKELSERTASAVEVVNRIVANEQDALVRSLTADKGYFAIEEIARIQEFDIRTVIGDANAERRRKEGLAAPLRKALHRAACAVKSQSGKALLRKRGMHLERFHPPVLPQLASLAQTSSIRFCLTSHASPPMFPPNACRGERWTKALEAPSF